MFWKYRAVCSMAGAKWNCCYLGPHSVYTIQPCTSLQCLFIQSQIGRVHVYQAVTCHLHFWQNDQDLLHATVVTSGWNRYQNQSQPRKVTLEKKLRLLLLTFRSWARRSTAEPSPLPMISVTWPQCAEPLPKACGIEAGVGIRHNH